ncbi:MAG: MFS transporter [Deltaproteobacteria bacterium]|nr:MFS transporter [Deltaproteobacteria bacterium]
MARPVSERSILFLVGAVQFVNILDFMMVMPLGPDFAKALGIPAAHLGVIGGSYTASAAVAGVVGARFLDRFDRKKALAVAMAGLVLGTALGGLAQGLYSLVAARIVAGAFGGPATSVAMSIIADVVPPERRGKAMGAVMGAFSVASVLGVPAGLELARIGGWQLPFFAVAGLGVVVAGAGIWLLPSLRMHLDAGPVQRVDVFQLLQRPEVFLSLGATTALMLSNFLVVPNLSAFLQFNLGYPRESMGVLYMVGGVISFGVMRLCGMLVDRIGSPAVALIGSTLMIGDLVTGILRTPPMIPVMFFFVTFMVAGSFRGVAINTQSSRVPGPSERAGFMSTQSAVQHLSAAAGAFLSSQLLTEGANHQLVGMPRVIWLSIGISILLPVFLFMVARRLARRIPSAEAPTLAVSGGS